MALNFAPILPPLQQTLWDKTLDTFLSGGFVYFWEDNNRSVPKDVYTLTGTGPGSYSYVSLGPVLTLSGIGTFVDENGGAIEVYLWPFTGSPNDAIPSQTVQNYYITVYSSTGVFQFDLPNIPGETGDVSPINTAETTDNILSNPEFSEVNFNPLATVSSPVVFTTTGTMTETDIAPDWSVITTGSGSFSVYQQTITDNTAPGNPAYALGITSSSYSQPIILRQRLLTPRIFSGQYVSATFIAEATSGGPYTLTMNYTPSITGTIQQLCTGVTPGSGFGVIFNSTPILITNPGAGTGYVDITIVIPTGASVQISCVQLCGVADPTEIVQYLEQTPEREEDHLFHYYHHQLNFKPIPSLLTGWDFALNPSQLGVTSFSTTPIYVWDQTICASVVGTVNVSRLSATQAFQATTTNDAEAFYMLQYLSGSQAIETTLSLLSSKIDAYTLTHAGAQVVITMYYSNTAGTIPALPTTIGTLSIVSGMPVFTLTRANWTQITQPLGQANSAPLPQFTIHPDSGFSGYNGLANLGSSNVNNFAIVAAFYVPTSGTNVIVQSISCVPGNIPTRPAPQTVDEVLRECQYYYEVSDTDGGGAYFLMNSLANPTGTSATSNAYAFASTFELNYATPKRVAPTISISSTGASTSGNVSASLYFADASNVFTKSGPTDKALATYWGAPAIGTSRVIYPPASTTYLINVNTISASSFYSAADISFKYILNAQLGVV